MDELGEVEQMVLEQASGGGGELFLGFIYCVASLAILYAIWKCIFKVEVVKDYEIGLEYRYGEYEGQLKPGARTYPRWMYQVTRIDMRRKDVVVPYQEVLTADNVPLKMSVALSFEVEDAEKAAHSVQNFKRALIIASQLELKSIVGETSAKDLLAKRSDIDSELRTRISTEAKKIGLKVDNIEIKEILFPSTENPAIPKAEARRPSRRSTSSTKKAISTRSAKKRAPARRKR